MYELTELQAAGSIVRQEAEFVKHVHGKEGEDALVCSWGASRVWGCGASFLFWAGWGMGKAVGPSGLILTSPDPTPSPKLRGSWFTGHDGIPESD